ncbi:hypothetical protein MVEG_01510 [Podila verticillata NRRL 6337]|nr:hypothetical protein MVEG_01510 [Podila verticillata NRRL 6337]
MTKSIASNEGPPIPRANGGRDFILQRDKDDQQTGFVPLHNWDVGMRRRRMGFYSTRKLMVEEFEYFGRDKNKMREMYGDHLSPIWRLLKAIRKRRMLHDDERARRAIETPNDIQDEEERERGEQGGQNGLNTFPVVPSISNWKEAVQQWEKGHLERGLMPIRDWPLEWRTLTPQTSALYQIYMSRELIAEEFQTDMEDVERDDDVREEEQEADEDKLLTRRRKGVEDDIQT